METVAKPEKKAHATRPTAKAKIAKWIGHDVRVQDQEMSMSGVLLELGVDYVLVRTVVREMGDLAADWVVTTPDLRRRASRNV